jgi:glycine reductase
MTLILHRHRVSEIGLGKDTCLEGGCLTVDHTVLKGRLMDCDDRLTHVRIATLHPGDGARVVCVKDVIEPRIKKKGDEPGKGITGVLDGLAVVTCGPIVGFQEGIIDMSGPGAAYTPFSSTPLLVLEVEVTEGLNPHEHEAAVREAGLAAAGFVAGACQDLAPDETEEISLTPLADTVGLPRIAYVYMVLSQGLLHDSYVMGRNAREGLPMIVAPEVICDTGIVSGNCVSACDKNTTYHHQNNPITAALLRGHGSAWDFAGIVVTNEPVRLGEKERSAEAAVDLVRNLKPDGAILSKEGFGNPDADMTMIVRALEQAGIATVAITDEFAGFDGGSQSLADTTPEANAVISTGNANDRITLPPMETTIGPLPDVVRLAGGYPHTLLPDGGLEVELQAIIGATNQLGFGRLSCREI